MDKFPLMVYKFPGSEEMHGHMFSTLIVWTDEELSEALANGWYETTTEAFAAESPKAEAQAPLPADLPAEFPTTRDGLEELATKLGVEFKPSTSDKKLAEAIKAKVA